MLFEHKQKPEVSIEDVEEVSNYVKAINYGLVLLKGDFPLSLRLVKEIHSILLSGGRGQVKHPDNLEDHKIGLVAQGQVMRSLFLLQ